ncbi:MAG: integration host factor subunit beta [Pseudomonadota bacterium]|nr:integration host factor subunit beta [Pseudomonadota bacterium]
MVFIMNRSGIIAKLIELYPQVNRKDVEGLVKNMFGAIFDSIIEDDRIEIRGFGSFSLKKRPPGVVRNPRDGISIQSGNRHVVYFRAGKELKDRVNASSK